MSERKYLDEATIEELRAELHHRAMLFMGDQLVGVSCVDLDTSLVLKGAEISIERGVEFSIGQQVTVQVLDTTVIERIKLGRGLDIAIAKSRDGGA